MKKVLLVVLLITLTVPLPAQQAVSPTLDGVKFVAPLQLSVGSDNNFLVDRTDPSEKLFVLSLSPSVQPGAPDIRPKVLDDTFFNVRLPKVAYRHDSRRHEFLITYQPEFEIFKTNSDQNAFSQQAMASFNYYLKRNIQVFIGDSYQTSKDPSRMLSNVFLLLPRSPYRSNSIHGTLDFQLNAVTNIGIGYDNAWTKFGQTDPFQTRILDSRASGYSLTFSRLLNAHQRINFRYSLYRIHPINQREEFDDAVDVRRPYEHPIHNFTVNYRIQPHPNVVVGASGGAIKLYNGMNYTMSASLHKRIGYFWTGGTYTRGLVFQNTTPQGFATGLGSNSFYDTVSLTFQGQPTRNTAILFDTTMSRGAGSQLIDTNKSLMGRVRFDYRLNDRNVLFTTWESFHQTRNAFVQAPLSRNRFAMGIEISLSSETSRRLEPLNEDTQYVALTDHGRRRRAPEDN